MNRVDRRGFNPPLERRSVNVAVVIVCAVAALSFTFGLMR